MACMGDLGCPFEMICGIFVDMPWTGRGYPPRGKALSAREAGGWSAGEKWGHAPFSILGPVFLRRRPHKLHFSHGRKKSGVPCGAAFWREGRSCRHGRKHVARHEEYREVCRHIHAERHVLLHHLAGVFSLCAFQCAGMAGGGVVTATLSLLLLDSTLKERAGIIAALYFCSYVGSGAPNFIIGRMSNITLDEIGIGFSVWVLFVWAVVVTSLLRMKKSPNEAESLRFKR